MPKPPADGRPRWTNRALPSSWSGVDLTDESVVAMVYAKRYLNDLFSIAVVRRAAKLPPGKWLGWHLWVTLAQVQGPPSAP
jgi:hypothetical protein